MYKDLLVALTDTPGDDTALRLAARLGARLQAHVAALVPVSLFTPLGADWGGIPDDLVARMHQIERERAHLLAERVRAFRTACIDVALELRVAESALQPRADIAAMHARHADLGIVAMGADTSGRGQAEAIFLSLLFDTGAPVLAVPPGVDPMRGFAHAVVAWRPTPEASRALRDALPLLREAGRVDVLVVDPASDHRYGPEPGSDIAAHLARHGLDVHVVVEPPHGESTPAAVLRHVLESGTDLVVAGGYGHSRFREAWLGGVTRTLLDGSPVPILFSH